MTECGREKSGRKKDFFNDDKVEMQEKEVIWEKREKIEDGEKEKREGTVDGRRREK